MRFRFSSFLLDLSRSPFKINNYTINIDDRNGSSALGVMYKDASGMKVRCIRVNGDKEPWTSANRVHVRYKRYDLRFITQKKRVNDYQKILYEYMCFFIMYIYFVSESFKFEICQCACVSVYVCLLVL